MAITDTAVNNPLASAVNSPVPQVPTAAVTPAPTPGTVNASQVYSPNNVMAAAASPAPTPDFTDPFKLYDSFYNSPELLGTRNEINTIQNEILGLNQTLRSSLSGFKQSPLSMNAVRGAQAAATETAALPLEALSENLTAKTAFYNTQIQDATNRYQIAKEQRSNIEDLIKQTGGNAKIAYTDSYETAIKKAQKYIDTKNEEEEKKQRKTKMADMYFELTGKTADKKWSSKELEKKLSKAGASKKAIENELQQLQLQKARLDLSTAKAGTTTQKTGQLVSEAQTALLSSRGTDGKVDPNVYAKYRAAYAEKTGSTTGFDEQFSNLLSSTEQSNLGVKSNLTATERVAQQKVEQAAARSTEQAKSALAAIEDLSKASGQFGAVGTFNFLSGIPGTSAADYKAKVDQVKALITLPEMQNLRGLGAMSDRDLAIIQKAASALDTNMSRTAFNKELKTIQDTLSATVNKINANPQYYTSGESDLDNILSNAINQAK